MIELTPHWERGHLHHGYWLGSRRLGFVSHAHRRKIASQDNPYAWSLDFVPTNGIKYFGTCKNLVTAKRHLEKAYQGSKNA